MALTGNVVKIILGGVTVGLVQNLSVQEDFGLMPVSGIGDVMPVEHTPGIGRINLSCEVVYVLKASEFGTGFSIPKAAEGKGYDSNFDALGIAPKTPDNILDGLVFDIQVTAGGSSSSFSRTYKNCSYASGSMSFQKHQLVIRNATFMATSFSVVG